MALTKKMKWSILGVVLILAFTASPVFGTSCCGSPLSDAAVITPANDSSAPDFTVPTLDGGTFTLSDQRGKPVVMFIMAYWCATCFKEAGELAKLADKYKDRVVVLALDIDPSSTPEGLARFKEQVGNPDFIWAFDKGGKVAESYEIKALDTTLIFNQSGEIVFTDSRSSSYKTLEKQIKQILE